MTRTLVFSAIAALLLPLDASTAAGDRCAEEGKKLCGKVRKPAECLKARQKELPPECQSRDGKDVKHVIKVNKVRRN